MSFVPPVLKTFNFTEDVVLEAMRFPVTLDNLKGNSVYEKPHKYSWNSNKARRYCFWGID